MDPIVSQLNEDHILTSCFLRGGSGQSPSFKMVTCITTPHHTLIRKIW